LSEGGGMAEIEHDIDALETKLRTAIEGVKKLDNGLLRGGARGNPPAGLDLPRASGHHRA
jgi:hypothetical protein